MTALSVVTFASAMLLGLFIYLADDPLPAAVCLMYNALLGASVLLFLGSFQPLLWRAPIGAIRFGVLYLIVVVIFIVVTFA